MPSWSPSATTAAVTRAFNTWVQLSDQRTARVFYTVTIKTAATLVAGITGVVQLEIADDNIGTNRLVISYGESGLDAGLLIPGSTGSINLAGIVPVTKYFRIVPSNTGSATIAYSSWNGNTNTRTNNSGFGTETLYD